VQVDKFLTIVLPLSSLADRNEAKEEMFYFNPERVDIKLFYLKK
jgi:hypothetical protein